MGDLDDRLQAAIGRYDRLSTRYDAVVDHLYEASVRFDDLCEDSEAAKRQTLERIQNARVGLSKALGADPSASLEECVELAVAALPPPPKTRAGLGRAKGEM